MSGREFSEDDVTAFWNGVLDAGFHLTRIEEPRPSQEYCQAYPSQRGWREHAALFLRLRAAKPA
jgi:hypothetical protein